MLTLTRKIGERIVIGDDIVLTVSGIKGDSVRLTIDAPRHVKIYRSEILAAIAAENKEAAAPQDLAQLAQLEEIFPKK